MTDKQGQIDYFEGLLAQHGANYKALDWNSPESQKLRYKVMKEILVYGKKASGISVMDVGCGLGDLYGFLKAEGILHKHRMTYTGYDISPKLIAAAKKKYPEAKIELKDIMEDRYVPKADYVFCSGIFNIRTSDENEHLDFVKEMLFRMFDLCACGLAVNFLSAGALPAADDLNASHYYYFEPEKIATFARFVTSRFIMRHDYHPGDFTLYLLK